ncbi:sensor histidine kinase [Methanolapillus millepedarum]|uniref:Histidine kinase/HSP90-like ATPase domain-containing protein n=1 Tax=Methanolapillus millepedarum TaxID=3028296 RepID=A0AA96ZTM9_9EURY|nr:hypothetical protein MsAc7_03100 [Methanosarcinaceae archaeon Ac7]
MAETPRPVINYEEYPFLHAYETLTRYSDCYREMGLGVYGLLRHDLQNYYSIILMSLELYRLKNDEKYLDKISEAAYKSLEYMSKFKDVEYYLYKGVVPGIYSLSHEIEEAFLKYPALSFSIQGNDYNVLADQALTVIFEFLFSNIVAYGNTGAEVSIFISEFVEDGVKKCRTDVTNIGDPIPEPVRGSLFLPGAKGPKSSGFGLGLYISKITAARYGGDLILKESTPEKTTFSLILPVVEVAEK